MNIQQIKKVTVFEINLGYNDQDYLTVEPVQSNGNFNQKWNKFLGHALFILTLVR